MTQDTAPANRREALEILGTRWTKGDKDRIYFNDLMGLLGWELMRYNTGNISSASLNGQARSNSEARRVAQQLIGAKIWFDLNDGRWWSQGLNPDTRSELIAAIRARADALIAGA